MPAGCTYKWGTNACARAAFENIDFEFTILRSNQFYTLVAQKNRNKNKTLKQTHLRKHIISY